MHEPGETPPDHGCGGGCAALLGVFLVLFGAALALKPTVIDPLLEAANEATPPSPADPQEGPAESPTGAGPQPGRPVLPTAPATDEGARVQGTAPGRSQPFGARVHLKNGRTISGQLIRATSREVVLRYAEGRLTLPRSQVQSIEELSEPERLRAQAQHERVQGRPDAADLLDQHARPSGPAPSYSSHEEDPAGPAPGGVIAELPESFAPAATEPGWPPGDVAWETDPERAFARAQAERKPILAYVGSVGCPHCKRMVQSTWRDPGVVAASRRDAVFWAIHRRGRGNAAASESAVRLGVRAYPQLFVLDPWGAPLELRGGGTRGTRLRVGRSAEAVLRAVSAGAERLPRRAATLAPLPAGLGGAAELSDPNGFVRARAWEPRLAGLSSADLARLFDWERDAVTRARVLNRLAGRQDAPPAVWAASLRDPNDYVRQVGLAAIAQRRERSVIPAVIELLERIAHPGSGRLELQNPNNVMSDLITTLEHVPDRRAEDVLVWLVRRLDLRNTNAGRAAAALGALWGVHPSPRIRAALEEGLAKQSDSEWAYGVFMKRLLRALSAVHGQDYTGYPLEEGLRRARAARGR